MIDSHSTLFIITPQSNGLNGDHSSVVLELNKLICYCVNGGIMCLLQNCQTLLLQALLGQDDEFFFLTKYINHWPEIQVSTLT